ncbi:MAG: hypothetical protein DRP85_09240 [Candidatus Makaraimicrobium thalassicum]|nr:MAG: hypothetical protein DRP85_09240 [Candidatus Omnitrophota bacterium]
MPPKDRFKTYITSLTPKDNIAILHHTDADGITAGLITKKSIKKLCAISIALHFHQNEGKITITKETIDLITTNNINKLIIVDMAIDHDPDAVKKLEQHARLLLIDHHKTANNINSKTTTVVKAEDLKDIPSAKYPASKMCYDLFSDLIDITDLAWLAAIGIWGDYAQSQWPDFLKKTAIPEHTLEEIDELIFYSGSIKEKDGLTDSFNILDAAKTPEDILKSTKLQSYKNTVITELNKYLDAHKKDAQYHNAGTLIIYEIAPKHKIKSRLINILSQKHYQNKTIVILEHHNTHIDISARRNDSKLSMNDMLKCALEGIPNSQGGGHIPAAGGYLPKEYLDKFKKQVITYCKEKDLQ